MPPAGDRRDQRWYDVVPRWLRAALLFGLLAATAFGVAQVTQAWSTLPAAVVAGALTGPLAFSVWASDTTRAGRSVAPDVLFTTFVVGGSLAIVVAGVFQTPFFYQETNPGYLWVSVVEESAKLLLPFLVCLARPAYRTVPRALALAVVSAAGFAVLESIAYAAAALDESVQAARDVLFQRSVGTAIGHLPWTAIAATVAARDWVAAGRLRVRPAALWGFAAAVGLHTAWNIALVERGWWGLLTPAVMVTTLLLLRTTVARVRYDGPVVTPREQPPGGLRRALRRAAPPADPPGSAAAHDPGAAAVRSG